MWVDLFGICYVVVCCFVRLCVLFVSFFFLFLFFVVVIIECFVFVGGAFLEGFFFVLCAVVILDCIVGSMSCSVLVGVLFSTWFRLLLVVCV